MDTAEEDNPMHACQAKSPRKGVPNQASKFLCTNFVSDNTCKIHGWSVPCVSIQLTLSQDTCNTWSTDMTSPSSSPVTPVAWATSGPFSVPYESKARNRALWLEPLPGANLSGATPARLDIKGTNWAGFQKDGCPHELYRHSAQSYVDFLVQNGFNAVRLTLSAPLVNANASVGSNCGEYSGQRTLDVLANVVSRLQGAGIFAMLGIHTLSVPESNNGLWCLASSCNAANEAPLWNAWSALATRFCTMPNVFAADLFNEPWSASWASGNAGLDWDTAAERLGNHVLSLCSRWLIFVNGIANIGGACRQSCLSRIPGSSASYCGGCWWGENVVRHVTNPVTLSVPEKLVLSPHVYGHSWSTFGYLYVANFPTNMPAVWDSHFGHVSAATGTPIVIGEFGGVWTQTVFNGDTFEATAVWQQAFVDYLVARGFGFFYWTLNDNSFRTGSLFNPASGRQERLQMLSAANSTSISAVQNYWRAQAALMPPPPLPLPPSPSPPPLFRAAIQPPPITAPVPT